MIKEDALSSNIRFEDWEAEQMKDPEFRAAVEELEPAYQVDRLIFWMEDLLTLARELQRDLERFYDPQKGWPPHIGQLEGPTDYGTILESAKKWLCSRLGEHKEAAEQTAKDNAI